MIEEPDEFVTLRVPNASQDSGSEHRACVHADSKSGGTMLSSGEYSANDRRESRFPLFVEGVLFPGLAQLLAQTANFRVFFTELTMSCVANRAINVS